MTTTATASAAATPSAAPTATPTTADRLAAVAAVQLAQAGKIGDLCGAALKAKATPAAADLAAATEILAALDLAAAVLARSLTGGVA